MQLTVKGKHLDVGDSLREHVRMNLEHTAGKYFQNPVDATVIFTKEKDHLYRADISVHLGGGVVLQAGHEANDPYPAFDVAAGRMATRLARYKDRVRDHHRWEDPVAMHAAAYTTFQANENDPQVEDGDMSDDGVVAGPITIAETEAQVPTLAVADAVMRLELGDLPALLFRNPAHGVFNLVYRRKDGNIGWVEPNAPLQTEKTKEELMEEEVTAVKKRARKKKATAKKSKTVVKAAAVKTKAKKTKAVKKKAVVAKAKGKPVKAKVAKKVAKKKTKAAAKSTSFMAFSWQKKPKKVAKKKW